MLTLEVTQRNTKESVDALRGRGFVPAVVYGHKEPATPITINARVFEKAWREAGETTIVQLQGLSHAMDTLIYEVQLHPVTRVPLHIDFYALEKGKKVTLPVPLEFVGEAPAEKLGHIVVKALHELEIEVAPQDIPRHLEVDISTLANVGDHISASQIKLPASATLITDGEETVASVTAFVEEKVEEAPAAAEAAPATPAEGEAPAAAAPQA